MHLSVDTYMNFFENLKSDTKLNSPEKLFSQAFLFLLLSRPVEALL